MSNDITRLQEIEARYQQLDPGPWKWRQGYGIGSRVHWALESPKSAAEDKVVSYLAVLYHFHPKSFGESVEDDPYLDFMARSREDIEWLCQQLRAAHAELARLRELVQWEPLVYSTFIVDQSYNDTYLLATLGGTQLEIGTDPTADGVTVNLPSSMRLCRRNPNAQPQEDTNA